MKQNHLITLSIYFLLQAMIPVAALGNPLNQFEILDIKNSVSIQALDEIYIAHKDPNSVQQGIRLLALGIEAWNPSLKGTGVRQQLMAHVSKEGVLSGLVAPSLLLIEKALDANKVEFAASLTAMVQHISPKFHSQINSVWSHPSLGKANFSAIVSKTDAQISTSMNANLGSAFQAYSNGVNSLALSFGMSQTPVSAENAQQFIQGAVRGNGTLEGFQQELVKNCKKGTEFKLEKSIKRSEFPRKHQNLIPKNNFSLQEIEYKKEEDECSQIIVQSINPKVNLDNIFQDKTWVEPDDCELVLKDLEAGQKIKKSKIELERERRLNGSSLLGSVQTNTCLGECAKSTLFWVAVGSYVGTRSAIPYGTVIGAVAGGVVGLVDCRGSVQCGGDRVANAKAEDEVRISRANAEKAESEARSARLSEELLRREAEKRDREEKERQQKEREEKKRQEEKENEERAKENARATREATPDKSQERHGMDSCNGSGCGVSNVANFAPTNYQFIKDSQKIEEQRKRAQEHFSARERAINSNPKWYLEKVMREESKDQQKLKKCLEKDRVTNRFPNDFLQKGIKEQKKLEAIRKRELDRISITTPYDPYPVDLDWLNKE